MKAILEYHKLRIIVEALLLHAEYRIHTSHGPLTSNRS